LGPISQIKNKKVLNNALIHKKMARTRAAT
jgi:hypothetical protein